jgi:hypothetical protein
MKHDEAIARIVKLVFQLSKELVAIDGADPNALWPLLPDREATDSFIPAKKTVNEILEFVRSLNGEMLSDDVILQKLLFGVAVIRMQLNISDNELEELARHASETLLDYKASRDVDIPIISLKVGKNPIVIGPVTFYPITADDKQGDWWIRAGSSLGDSVDSILLSYARVNVPGDVYKSINNALYIVNEVLLLLRGIGFPIRAQEMHQFGIVNEYPVWKNVSYRLGRPKETTRIDSHPNFVTQIGPANFPYSLREDILTENNQNRLEPLLSLVTRSGFSPKGEMNTKILSGFRWLGEATKPDVLSARFAKLAFSLETFIGGESKDESLTTRGITATLAERAAFLLGNDLNSRKKVDEDIRRFYSKRSGINHGKIIKVEDNDFEEFGQLVREIGWSLIEKKDQITSIDQLQEWIINQRYSVDPTP